MRRKIVRAVTTERPPCVSRSAVGERVTKAAGHLLAKCPDEHSLDPAVLVQAADMNELPIGTPDTGRDPVANAIVVRAYRPNEKGPLMRAIDMIVDKCNGPRKAPA